MNTAEKRKRLNFDVRRSLTKMAFYYWTVLGFPKEMFVEEISKMTTLDQIGFIKDFIKDNPEYSANNDIFIAKWKE